MTETPNSSPGASNPGRIGVIAVGLLVLVIAVAAVVTTLRPPQDLDPGSVEGVVQRFFQAVEARDFEAAHALLGPGLAERCTVADLTSEPSEFDRAVIDDVVTNGSGTVVFVDVRRIDVSDPLNPYTYDETMEFELDSGGESPIITRLPWQFFCGGKR
jgi:hypothetical protein